MNRASRPSTLQWQRSAVRLRHHSSGIHQLITTRRTSKNEVPISKRRHDSRAAAAATFWRSTAYDYCLSALLSLSRTRDRDYRNVNDNVRSVPDPCPMSLGLSHLSLRSPPPLPLMKQICHITRALKNDMIYTPFEKYSVPYTWQRVYSTYVPACPENEPAWRVTRRRAASASRPHSAESAAFKSSHPAMCGVARVSIHAPSVRSASVKASALPSHAAASTRSLNAQLSW